MRPIEYVPLCLHVVINKYPCNKCMAVASGKADIYITYLAEQLEPLLSEFLSDFSIPADRTPHREPQ